jgi:small subunit ribosomal protein S16
MVKIRMKSFGRRHRPFYRICVMDARTPRDGRAIEELGWYDPLVRNESAREWFNTPRVRYWLSVGAQPTEKVAAMLKRHGITKPANGEAWDDVPAQERPAPGAKTTHLTGGPAPKPKAAPPAPEAEAEAPAAEAPAEAAPAAEEPKAEETQS